MGNFYGEFSFEEPGDNQVSFLLHFVLNAGPCYYNQLFCSFTDVL